MHRAIKARKGRTSPLFGLDPVRSPTLGPLTRTLSGGDGIRTHGLYIANVEFLDL